MSVIAQATLLRSVGYALTPTLTLSEEMGRVSGPVKRPWLQGADVTSQAIASGHHGDVR